MPTDRRPRARAGLNGSAGRTSRDDSLLTEVRRLSRAALPQRLRRLEQMERAARVWVNGRAVGAEPASGHLYETYD
jgi:hypothetical protein